MLTVLVMMLAAWLGVVANPDPAQAQEARCTELGANCVCSEPLQMTGFAVHPGGSWRNPNDSTVKECEVEYGLGAGWAIARSLDPLISSNPAVLAALPTGHSVNRFATFPDGYTGGMAIGHGMGPSTSFVKRVSLRWYEYYSPNYAFDDDPESCNASKLFEMNSNVGGMITDIGYGPPSIYNFLTFNLAGSQDCCGYGGLNVNMPTNILQTMGGPAFGSPSPYYSYYRGKWVRWEIVVVNRDSSVDPWEQHVYVKNITDNGAEYEVASSCDVGGNLAAPCTQRATAVFNNFHVNGYRQDNCPGTRAYSHLLFAGWDTNAGQRIGAAVEIESGGGSGGDTTPPAAPLNLRLSGLLGNEILASN